MELGIGEFLVIAIIIVVLFGPDKLPSIARDLGQGVRKMKAAMEDIKSEVMKEADNPISEIKKEIEKVKESVEKVNPMADVQKQIDEMKNSINPMSSTKISPKPVSDISTDEVGLDSSDGIAQESDPLADEHIGPVSR